MKTKWQRPVTRKTVVKCERGFCASVVDRDRGSKVEIDNQYDGSWNGRGDDINIGWEDNFGNESQKINF